MKNIFFTIKLVLVAALIVGSQQIVHQIGRKGLF